MKTEHVNYLNIGLMIMSTVTAFIIPFELFLFAYAVLGPLHYLTEISWLHDKGYFTKNKYDYLFLGVLCILLLIVSYVIKQKPDLENGIIYVAFFSSLTMILIKDNKIKLFAILLIVISILLLKDLKPYQIFFAIFLPTIMHVFVFTGAFILVGALKGKSKSGIASLAVFALCAISFFVHVPNASGYQVGTYVRDSYATFQVVNIAMLKVFHLGDVQSIDDIYNSQAGLVVMRFIAFAYIYHYLNWFSKTSIIKWNNISRIRMVGIAVLWLVSLSIYAYSYKAGIVALFFLSFLHVFLEFPLDHQTFIGIGKELFAMARR
ncbi:MAG: hypothetical protein HYR76_02725 [Ignavibacteria bacterium]|nr:hypothetical protein [Ignavibacteria bacterium]